VLILKGVKVVCFDTLLQVLILKGVKDLSGIGENRDEREEYGRFVRDNTSKHTTDLDVCQ
jgi:hypothetical protein